MADPNSERNSESYAQFERSQKMGAIVARTIEVTQKIGGALMKVASDIFGMFKR